MVVGDVAVETVVCAAVGTFDIAVGLNRQKDARMAVPSFMLGTRAVQRQVFGFDDNDFGSFVHDFSFEDFAFIVRYIGGLCSAKGRLKNCFCWLMLWL